LGYIKSFTEWITLTESSKIKKEIENELKFFIKEFKKECIKLGFNFLADEHNFLSLYDLEEVKCTFELIKSECKNIILLNENYSCN